MSTPDFVDLTSVSASCSDALVWPKCDFSKIVVDLTRYAVKIQASEYLSAGRYPVVDQGSDNVAGYTNRDAGAFTDRLPAIVFGDHTRRFKFIENPFFLGADGAKLLAPKNDWILPKFLYFALQSFEIPDHGYSRHFKFLKEARLPLPPLDEQRRIVEVLERAAGIRRLREQALEKARALIPALFLDMFGDPATNPKGWETRLFSDLITDLRNGLNPPKSAFGSGFPFVTVNNLYNGLFVRQDEIQKVSISNAEQEKYRLNMGDLCFVRSSVKRSGVGAVSVFDGPEGAVFGGFVIRARLEEGNDPIFFAAQFSTPSMRRIVVESSGTGTVTNIAQPAIKSVRVICPPAGSQSRFADRVAEIRAIIAQQERSLDAARALERSLMARLLG